MLACANRTRRKIPTVPFQSITDKILGSSYNLSLVFVGDQLARELNQRYRRRDKIANVLSFPLSKKEGEIFINLGLAQAECKKFFETYPDHVQHLFIHGLLHLKGMTHSSKMEKAENRWLNFFSTTNEQESHCRNRCRHNGHTRGRLSAN